MISNKQTWVSPDENGWRVHHPRGKRASGIFKTQQEAIKRGREISQNQKTEFIVQGRNGRIRMKDSHGCDEYPPVG